VITDRQSVAALNTRTDAAANIALTAYVEPQ
jgi:hypothetical protein